MDFLSNASYLTFLFVNLPHKIAAGLLLDHASPEQTIAAVHAMEWQIQDLEGGKAHLVRLPIASMQPRSFE